jgi:hypothetical protein
MVNLNIPQPLKEEFATIEALWRSDAKTRGVDSLLLSWVKYEKQIRRLFCFLVYQHPSMTGTTINSVVTKIAQNRALNPEKFMQGIRALGVTPVPTLVGTIHPQLAIEIKRIKGIRNKLMHGQVTGLAIKQSQLQRDVQWLVQWIAALASGADAAFGYDGLRRNTFRVAKANANVAVAVYPFSSPGTFDKWLRNV